MARASSRDRSRSREWGVLETPIALATTMTVGRAYDGIVQAMIASHDGAGVADCIIPVVGECDDSWLDDARACP